MGNCSWQRRVPEEGVDFGVQGMGHTAGDLCLNVNVCEYT